MDIKRLRQLAGLFEADDPRPKKKDDAKPSRETDYADDDEKEKPDLSGFYHHKDQPLDKLMGDKDDESDSDDGDHEPSHTGPKGASKETTDKAASGINIHPDAAKHFANLHKNMPTVGLDDEPHSDMVVRIDSKNLPAHLHTALKKAGDVNVDWHLVSNLPGNAAAAIRQLGKHLFGALTTTPTNDITMIGNLGGQGKPNTAKEVNSVAQYIRNTGEDFGPGHIDFDAIMPGYKATVHHFVSLGTEFMLVKDFAGEYIYAWPAHTSKNKGVKATVLDPKAPLKPIKAEPKKLN